MSENLDQQLKLAHKMVDFVDHPYRRDCVSLLRYNVGKPENSYTQVRLLEKMKEDKIFDQFVYVKQKLEKFMNLLNVMNSVYDKIYTDTRFCIVQKEYLQLFTLYDFPF